MFASYDYNQHVTKVRKENINTRLITGVYLCIVAGQSPGPYLAFLHVCVDPANVDVFLFFHVAN